MPQQRVQRFDPTTKAGENGCFSFEDGSNNQIRCLISFVNLGSRSDDVWIVYCRYFRLERGWIGKTLVSRRITDIGLGNVLHDNRILDLSKLGTFSEEKFIVAEMVQFLFDRLENILGKGKYAVF